MAAKLVILLQGGLGNQLFQLCGGETIRDRAGVAVTYDVETLFRHDPFGRRCEVLPWIPQGAVEPPSRSLLQRAIGKSHTWLAGKAETHQSQNFGLAAVPLDGLLRAIRRWPGSVCSVMSNFQALEYVHDGVVARLREGIAAGSSEAGAAVHLRWLRDRLADGGAVAELTSTLIPPQYYRDALVQLRGGQAALSVNVFTDGAAVPPELFAPQDRVAVDEPPPGDTAWNALARMARFRTLVIANSTFSWWAAYLAGPEARVLYPRPWPMRNGWPPQSGIFPAHWSAVPWGRR